MNIGIVGMDNSNQRWKGIATSTYRHCIVKQSPAEWISSLFMQKDRYTFQANDDGSMRFNPMSLAKDLLTLPYCTLTANSDQTYKVTLIKDKLKDFSKNRNHVLAKSMDVHKLWMCFQEIEIVTRNGPGKYTGSYFKEWIELAKGFKDSLIAGAWGEDRNKKMPGIGKAFAAAANVMNTAATQAAVSGKDDVADKYNKVLSLCTDLSDYFKSISNPNKQQEMNGLWQRIQTQYFEITADSSIAGQGDLRAAAQDVRQIAVTTIVPTGDEDKQQQQFAGEVAPDSSGRPTQVMLASAQVASPAVAQPASARPVMGAVQPVVSQDDRPAVVDVSAVVQDANPVQQPAASSALPVDDGAIQPLLIYDIPAAVDPNAVVEPSPTQRGKSPIPSIKKTCVDGGFACAPYQGRTVPTTLMMDNQAGTGTMQIPQQQHASQQCAPQAPLPAGAHRPGPTQFVDATFDRPAQPIYHGMNGGSFSGLADAIRRGEPYHVKQPGLFRRAVAWLEDKLGISASPGGYYPASSVNDCGDQRRPPSVPYVGKFDGNVWRVAPAGFLHRRA